ncbi:MAG: hypothetical protein IJT79_05160 [Ruminococcus sp.]|nr:hypothetical protein [Ruminococcus sp.]
MNTNDFLYEQVIDCIPSADLRAHLKSNPIELSVLQKATIISYFSDIEQITALFEQLAKHTSSLAEKELLLSAISEIKTVGYIDKKTQAVFESKYPHDMPPFFPFLERCYLPVLFSGNDIIRCRGEVYKVASVPLINDKCDFSDECYLCYPLNNNEHHHIHIGEAERASNGEVVVAMNQK